MHSLISPHCIPNACCMFHVSLVLWINITCDICDNYCVCVFDVHAIRFDSFCFDVYVQLYLKKLLNFLSSLTVCVNRCSISKNIHFIFISRYQRPVSVTLNPTCLSQTAEVYFFFHMSCLRTRSLFLFFPLFSTGLLRFSIGQLR